MFEIETMSLVSSLLFVSRDPINGVAKVARVVNVRNMLWKSSHDIDQ